MNPIQYSDIVSLIADILKEFDAERPVHKNFKPGIGPFGEPQLIREVAKRLSSRGVAARTKRTPDLDIENVWAIEAKIVRPFGDNGRQAENWSVNLLHPYEGNTSLVGDALKLSHLDGYKHRCLLVIGFEHHPPKISLDPLLESFEAIVNRVTKVSLGRRLEEKREGLVHPEHQIVRCVGWEVEH